MLYKWDLLHFLKYFIFEFCHFSNSEEEIEIKKLRSSIFYISFLFNFGKNEDGLVR